MKRFYLFVLGLLLLFAGNGARAADPVPTITSPSYVTTLVGQPFSYQITATGHPTSFGSYYLYGTNGLTYDQSKGLFPVSRQVHTTSTSLSARPTAAALATGIMGRRGRVAQGEVVPFSR